MSLGDKSGNEQVLSVETNNNGKLGVCTKVNDHTDCQKTLLPANVFSAHQGVDTSDSMIDNVLLYDINMGSCDDNFELSNALLLKDGWKRHVPYLEKNCSDFSLWRS